MSERLAAHGKVGAEELAHTMIRCFDNHGAHVTVGLLHKCKAPPFPPPCITSAGEFGGSVVAVRSIPPNDPRFHGGGPAPEVTSVTPRSRSPATAAPSGA